MVSLNPSTFLFVHVFLHNIFWEGVSIKLNTAGRLNPFIDIFKKNIFWWLSDLNWADG